MTFYNTRSNARDSILRTVLFLTCAICCSAQPSSLPVEPGAGTWKTWAIPSGKAFRAPAPPDAASTRNELAWLRGAVAEKNEGVVASIQYWSAGAPSYRWMQLISDRIRTGAPVSAYSHRLYTYVSMAMYDATIATWDSKYAYNRARPGETDPSLQTRLATPHSPSYPSEHAATAAAAAGVLSYFFPNEAAAFQDMAEEAGKSQLYAGVSYPTDYFAGLDLGKQVAARVIELAKADGSEIPWTGTIPVGKCNWIGNVPVNAAAAIWKPILLNSPSEFRPAPPMPCDSPGMAPQIQAVRDFPRTFTAFNTNSRAMYWNAAEGINYWPYVFADKWMFEDGLDANAPRAARVYAMIAISLFDAFIASQDGKFTYWYIRPPQLDNSISPLFPVPPFPSYPSNHSVFSATRSEVLAYLFPKHADEIRIVGKEGGDSRIWAGIHFPMDNDAGVEMGRSIAKKFIAWAAADGSK